MGNYGIFLGSLNPNNTLSSLGFPKVPLRFPEDYGIFLVKDTAGFISPAVVSLYRLCRNLGLGGLGV